MPGEVVMNAGAVARIGADRLMKANRFAEGGAVPPTHSSPAGGGGDSFGQAMTAFSRESQALAAAFSQFYPSATALAGALSKFPSSVTMQGQVRHEVILNGAEVLARMQDGLQAYIMEQANKVLRQALKEKLPDVA
jgi:hypothetical protein